MILMRILIYGAGVIGSLYAVLFAEAGYDTNIYARGKRLEALRNNGLKYKKNQEINPKELSSFMLIWKEWRKADARRKGTVIGEKKHEKWRI